MRTVPKIIYSKGFLAWLKEEDIEGQEDFTLQALFEIYINSLVWGEVEEDPELPKSYLEIRT